MLSLGGKPFTSKAKKKKETKQKKQTKKEGLGPSEVALWATSPDPETLPKNKKK